MRSPAKDSCDPDLHSRNVSVLLLSKLLRRAGVFSGLDFESKESPDDPPATRRGGFLNFSGQWSVVSCQFSVFSFY
jgi:hypothetical protein